MKKEDLETKRKALKDEAQKHLAKNKWEKALEAFLQLWKLSQGTKEEQRLHLKIGDLLQKLNRTKEAVAVYKKTATNFAHDGFLIQAISVCKMILAIDPQEIEIKNLLSNLYAERGMDKIVPLATRRSAAAPVESAEPKNVDDLLEDFFSEDFAEESHELPVIPLFSRLNRHEFKALIDSLTPWRIPEGTVICQEGDPAESMFVIAEGGIEVFTGDKSGRTKVLARLKPGDFFGEIGLFTRAPRTATCRAVGETDLLEMKRADFDQIVMQFPRVKDVLHNFYKKRILDTVLAKSAIFGPLDAKTRQALVDRFVAEEYGDGRFIIEEGEAGEAMYMIRDGSVEVLTKKGGQALTLATLGPGEFFGEVALISNQKRTASVKVKGRCDCLRLSRKDFEWVAREAPEVLKIVKDQVERRVKETLKVVSKTGR